MKKLAGLIAVAAFAMSAQAQEPQPPETKYYVADNEQAVQENKEGIIFKNGKAWMVKDGQTMVLEKEMTMGNGMKVLPTGRVIMQNGEQAWLTDNDFVHMDGAVEREIPVKTAGEKDANPDPGGG